MRPLVASDAPAAKAAYYVAVMGDDISIRKHAKKQARVFDEATAFVATLNATIIGGVALSDDGEVRCLTVVESAALMGFPLDWSYLSARAPVCVPSATPCRRHLPCKAVMSCAVAAARSLLETSPPAQEPAPPEPPAPQEPAPPKHERRASKELAGLRSKLRRLAKRVDGLEGRGAC